MRNHVSEGNAITVVTPAGGYVSGRGYVVNDLFGVALNTTSEGAKNELYTKGVYALDGEGDLFAAAYFDPADGSITDTSATGLYKVGVIVGASTGKVEVRLNGVDVAAVA